MKAVLVAGVGLAFAAAAVLIFLHRRNHRPQPCPWWLSVLVENPYMNAVGPHERPGKATSAGLGPRYAVRPQESCP